MRQGTKEIIQRVGATSILVTHDQEEAFDIADQIVIFNRWDPAARLRGIIVIAVPCRLPVHGLHVRRAATSKQALEFGNKHSSKHLASSGNNVLPLWRPSMRMHSLRGGAFVHVCRLHIVD